MKRTPLRKKSQSPLAIAHENLWTALSLMIRETENWTCFTCGTKVNPRTTDERDVSMAFYMHGGHYSPRGLFKAVKYDPFNIHAQCVRCNKWLHGNLAAYATALEKRYGFGMLGLHRPNLQRAIARGIPAPKPIVLGTVKVRLWTKADVERARKALKKKP
jgi:Bacteriophage Lambda NinG protein